MSISRLCMAGQCDAGGVVPPKLCLGKQWCNLLKDSEVVKHSPVYPAVQHQAFKNVSSALS